MFLQDVVDAIKEEGLAKGVAMSLPGATGISVQTYPPQYNEWMAKYPETIRLNISNGAVTKSVSYALGKSIDFTDKEVELLQKWTSAASEAAVRKVLSSASYSRGTDEKRKELIAAAITAARETQRKRLLSLIPDDEKRRRFEKKQFDSK
jgi:hypothetical protein